ncbi:MAG: metallophosphoesterase [Pseudomonadota bacterium]
MLRRLLGGKTERRRALARPEIEMPAIAPERPVYAVGDLHGRADLLLRIIEMIMEDCAGVPGPPSVVFLGDYIDRGDEVRTTLAMLEELARHEEIETVFLMGNHERMLLNFLEDPAQETRWLRVGGLQTCLSFEVGAYETSSRVELARVQAELVAALGPHLRFLRELRTIHQAGNVLFVHAAADPSRAPDAQTEEALLWGHAEFERRPRADGLWVVHGHRVVSAPRIERGRISVDTGAYFSGALTAAAIAPGEVRFLTATASGAGAGT